MLGYWRQKELTDKAIVNGWMKTGDGAKMDDEGYIFIVDRVKENYEDFIDEFLDSVFEKGGQIPEELLSRSHLVEVSFFFEELFFVFIPFFVPYSC